MKKALALAAILAWVTSANALVQIFFTSSADAYGLTNPAVAFDPSGADQMDAATYQVAAFPPTTAFDAIPDIDYSAGQFAYIWGRFVSEANNVKIQGMHFDLSDQPSDVAYYIMNDLAGDNGQKRYDGAATAPNEPEFKQDPQILASVDASGIKNRSTTVDNWNLYTNTTRTFLLGAVRYDSGSRTLRSAQLGSLGVVMKGTGAPFSAQVAFGSANWIPEPASIALLGLAGLLIRRR